MSKKAMINYIMFYPSYCDDRLCPKGEDFLFKLADVNVIVTSGGQCQLLKLQYHVDNGKSRRCCHPRFHHFITVYFSLLNGLIIITSTEEICPDIIVSILRRWITDT